MNQEKVTRMKKLIAGFSDYVGTKKSYCALHQIKPYVFDYWRKKINLQQERSTTFVPISLKVSEVTVHLDLYYENGRRMRIPTTTPVSLIEHLLKLQIDV